MLHWDWLSQFSLCVFIVFWIVLVYCMPQFCMGSIKNFFEFEFESCAHSIGHMAGMIYTHNKSPMLEMIYTTQHGSHGGHFLYPHHRSHGRHDMYPERKSHGEHDIYNATWVTQRTYCNSVSTLTNKPWLGAERLLLVSDLNTNKTTTTITITSGLRRLGFYMDHRVTGSCWRDSWA